MTAVPAPAGIPVTPPGLAHLPVPPPIAAPERQNAATKTMFGVTAPPAVAEALKPAPEVQRSMRATVVGQAVPESPPATGGSVPSKADRKTGARKTAVPAPEVIPPAAGAAPPPAAAAAASDTGRAMQPSPAPSPAAAAPEPVLARPAPAAPEDRTQPVRVAAKKSRSGSIWTYVGVGFLFGLALLGIYQLVGVLAH
jgi:hypothetical protein